MDISNNLDEKKIYTPIKLTKLGNIADLTEFGYGGGGGMFMNMVMNMNMNMTMGMGMWGL